MVKNLLKALQIDSKNLILIILGAISLSLVMVRSGLPLSEPQFWGANGHDGIWHIAVASQLAKGSLEFPVFAGQTLRNYHIGFSLVLAFVHRVTTIPISILYFQIFPPIIALLIGISVYKLVMNLVNDKTSAFWSLFFVYFGGSFGWLVSFIRDGSFGGESMFWSQQAVSTLINPPYALSLVVLVTGLNLIIHKKHWDRSVFIAAILFGLLIQIKAYAGILALFSLLVVGIWQYIFKKSALHFQIFSTSLLISLMIFLPLNEGSNSLIIYKPFWFLETMMQLTDRVGWLKFGEAMVNYKLAHNYPKLMLSYTVAFLIFWYGNLALRFLGEVFIAKKLLSIKKILPTELFIILIIASGTAVTMLFVQEGTAWNTIQFFYYSIFFMAIISGIAFRNILQNTAKYSRYFMILFVVIFTLPTTVNSLKSHYLTKNPPSYLPLEEKEALDFLKEQQGGIVLTYPFDEVASMKAPAPRPLYLYVSSSYVGAYSKNIVFLEDEVNLTITNYDWKQRRQEIENFYNLLDEPAAYAFLRENNIKYVYWVKPQRARLGETQLGLERIFENEKVDIYKVK